MIKSCVNEEIQFEGLQIVYFKTINLLNLGAGRGVGGNRNASVVFWSTQISIEKLRGTIIPPAYNDIAQHLVH